jgi:hypothetical protein
MTLSADKMAGFRSTEAPAFWEKLDPGEFEKALHHLPA